MKSTFLHHAAPQPAPEPTIRPIHRLPGSAAADVVKRGGLDVRHLWHLLLEKLWIVILCTVAGLFLGLGYLAKTPKLYQGHIVLEVDVAESRPLQDSDSSRVRTMFLATVEAMRTI